MSDMNAIPSLSDLLSQNGNGGIAGNSLLRPQSSNREQSSGVSAANAAFLSGTGGTGNVSPISQDMAKAGLTSSNPAQANPSLSNNATSNAGVNMIAGSQKVDAPGFRDMFEGLIKGVHQKQLDAAGKKRDILLGKSDNIHEAMVSAQEAGVAFNLMIQVRNKLVDSYKELLRMRV